jgi:hypothetical protein
MAWRQLGSSFDAGVSRMTERAARKMARRNILRTVFVGGAASIAAISLPTAPATAAQRHAARAAGPPNAPTATSYAKDRRGATALTKRATGANGRKGCGSHVPAWGTATGTRSARTAFSATAAGTGARASLSASAARARPLRTSRKSSTGSRCSTAISDTSCFLLRTAVNGRAPQLSEGPHVRG